MPVALALLQAALATALTGWALSRLLGNAWRAAPDTRGGELVLRYGRGTWILGLICGALVPAGMLAIAFGAGFRDPGQIVPFGLLLAGFSLAGWWLLLEAGHARLVVTERELCSHTFWRRPIRLAWSEVVSVHFGSASGYLVLTGTGGERLRASVLLAGFPSLLERLTANLPPSVYADALEALAGHNG